MTTSKQFQDLKKQYPDAILLFRCGDFYECYNEDAEVASKVLNITLTKRDNATLMAGFPYHALDTYLPKLVRAGKRVAICDTLEEPITVKRPVSELPQDEPKKEEQPTEEPKPLPKGLSERTARQLTLFPEQPSEYLLHFRDEVAMRYLLLDVRLKATDAAETANNLVKALYGIDLSKWRM